MSTKRSRVHPPYKTRYRVTNWASYNKTLVDGGNLRLWISPDAIANWNAKPSKPGTGPLVATCQNGLYRWWRKRRLKLLPRFTGSTFYFRSLGHNRFGALDFSQMLVPVGQRDWASLSRRHYPQAGDEDGLDLGDLVNLTSGVTTSGTVRSAGVEAPAFAVLHYEPWDRAQDQIPAASYSVSEVFGEYSVAGGGTDDFLSIVLARIEAEFGLPDFAADFTADFEMFLQSADTDDNTPGNQPYLSPSGDPILTLSETHWFGPAQTWPKEVPNWPYIEFWHRLDTWLFAEGITGMGPETIGDGVWEALFSPGRLAENIDITMYIARRIEFEVSLEAADQLGAIRPANELGDVGAREIP